MHHLYGSPIVPFIPLSSAGCAICDLGLAAWYFADAPSPYRWISRAERAEQPGANRQRRTGHWTISHPPRLTCWSWILDCPEWMNLKSSDNCAGPGRLCPSLFYPVAPMKPVRSRRSIWVWTSISPSLWGVDELLARVRAAVRDRLQEGGERPIFKSGEISVDFVRRNCRSRSRGNSRRQKLEENPVQPKLIATEQGVGYRLRAAD